MIVCVTHTQSLCCFQSMRLIFSFSIFYGRPCTHREAICSSCSTASNLWILYCSLLPSMISVNASLARLQTDYIDVLQMHCWDDGAQLSPITCAEITKEAHMQALGNTRRGEGVVLEDRTLRLALPCGVFSLLWDSFYQGLATYLLPCALQSPLSVSNRMPIARYKVHRLKRRLLLLAILSAAARCTILA